ncbi:putative casein kinase ii subunit beta [Monocercomonoides exilis]|uniref:putative casein kinase ii subunit beta n=1 Tax=Monocercomonoides exilis TaxID=2049356 RepID=UPI00355A2DDB|nr:putative casein kinase ii subunit beta [Monocercomonoides exilis]|eukprot:MONOS_6856.1-p1 / transcript=MONOS_6856.1 / gene=MONOS_6856 / organism=Monocercomonoides_exilis_PA203 / gene_product=casein kinase ii subunit beta, putative / transcript_product=casein kinase ii subunit beta, putative / location=Mono_scaffold00224:40168-41778(+) / protein_length=515 / sequence_SO=supercontig / SO=protein_coding / is_pseudo=false
MLPFDDDTGDEEDSEVDSWIEWFCCARGNEFFCQVDRSFIENEYNLTGLSGKVPNFNLALSEILDDSISESEIDLNSDDANKNTCSLYMLIHARYITTQQGLRAMKKKYENLEFGTCPNVLCNGHPVIPVGKSFELDQDTVKVFCPCCEEIYTPTRKRHFDVDGAAFGPSFVHVFLQQFPKCFLINRPPPVHLSIYGFKMFTRYHSDLQKFLAAKISEKRRQKCIESDGEDNATMDWTDGSEHASETMEERKIKAARRLKRSEESRLKQLRALTNKRLSGRIVPDSSDMKIIKKYLGSIPFPPLPRASYFQKSESADVIESDKMKAHQYERGLEQDSGEKGRRRDVKGSERREGGGGWSESAIRILLNGQEQEAPITFGTSLVQHPIPSSQYSPSSKPSYFSSSSPSHSFSNSKPHPTSSSSLSYSSSTSVPHSEPTGHFEYGQPFAPLHSSFSSQSCSPAALPSPFASPSPSPVTSSTPSASSSTTSISSTHVSSSSSSSSSVSNISHASLQSS